MRIKDIYIIILFSVLLPAGRVYCVPIDTASINRRLEMSHKVLDPDSAIQLYDDIFRESTALNYADGAFLALITKGIKYYEKEDYEQYRMVTLEALPWALKSSQKDAPSWCYINIGEAYMCEGDYIKASEYFYTALKELKKVTGDTPNHTLANIYNDFGHVHIRMNQPEKAMQFYNMAEDVARRGNLPYQLANAYIYKGEYYTSIDKTDTARKYFMQVLEIGKRIDKTDLLAIGNNDLGKNYIAAGEYEKAVAHLQKAIALAQNKFPYIVVDASYSLGDAWYHLHRYKDAEVILTTALHDMLAHNYRDLYVKCYTKLIAVYKATGQYHKALEFTDKVSALKDSLMNAEKAKAINQMEIKYQTAEKDMQIARNQLLIARQSNKITRKNIWITSIAGSIFLLLIIAMGTYRNIKNKQRLQAEQIKLLQKENTIGILKGVVQGEENERTRIARELHDGIGGMLSAAMMRFSSIRHENADATKIPAYKEGMGLLNEMGDEIRKTAHNLMPDVLVKQTLPEALRSYCSYVQSGGTLQIDFQSYGHFGDLDQNFKLNLYRIVQELVKNIVQHAKATHALVQLMMHDHTLSITVEDNGTGFNTHEVKSGMGLNNLKTRVLSLGGQYTVEAEEGKGTSVLIEIDIPHSS
ncbi:MAG: signal transduction histidine kinase [Flavipsychrobacter sp.]|jgi:signal transduction histidine kinase|nr:signal transduction histidine kinase [Flavipsychrobacter sp.]